MRLWVPHWSIWALPFTAHEFWHVAASLGIWDKLREHLDPEEHCSDPALDTCLADAFATYTIGPAYAYAAVTLLLNPPRRTSRLGGVTNAGRRRSSACWSR